MRFRRQDDYYTCVRFRKLMLNSTLTMLAVLLSPNVFSQTPDTFRPTGATDPGPRGGAAGAGGAIGGLVGNEGSVFASGLEAFSEVDSVTGVLTEGKGL